MHATGQYQTHATLVSAVDTFREPFKDFFDYEWWLQGSEYAGKGRQYGKWRTIESNLGGDPQIQLMYISDENPITGTDSAVMEVDGSASVVRNFAWAGVRGPYEPDSLTYPVYLNPVCLSFKFRIDEWITTYPEWRVTLAGFGGLDGGSTFEIGAVIGLEGLAPPKLRLHYRIGDSYDWWTDEFTQKVLSEQTISLGEVHTIELIKYYHPTNGVVEVWLDGVKVPDLTFGGLDTSFPGGIKTVYLGNSPAVENGFFGVGHSGGSSCKISFDDYRVTNQQSIFNPLPSPAFYDLTLDSSPQGKTIRVGNHVLEAPTPVTIQVPEGTVPKIGIDPNNFDHWEISPAIEGFPMSEWEEIWVDITPTLISTVTRGVLPGETVGSFPTPAIYQDMRITAIYSTSVKHTLSINGSPTSTPFTVDELDYTTPWSDQLTEGTHTISVPSTFTDREKRYDFRKWEDDSTNPNRTVNLLNNMDIIAYYDVTIVPEFPTLIAWLAVVGVATLTIVLNVRKLRERSTFHRHCAIHRRFLTYA